MLKGNIKMKKRLIALFLLSCIVCCLSACNSDNADSEEGSDHIHQYSAATCTAPKTCSCGDTIGIALDHNFEVATCTSPKICTRCNLTEGKELGHEYIDATCVSPKFCKRCDSILDNELGHDFVDGKCTRCEKYDRTYLIEDIDYLEKTDKTCYNQERITDNQGNEHFGRYVFTTDGTFYDGYISFQLDKKFKSFSGLAFLSYADRGDSSEVYIKVYGDDKLLYQTKDMKLGHIPDSFTIDITGVSILKISFEPYSSMNTCTYAYLTDAYLVK